MPDKQQIDDLTKSFFDLFTNKEGHMLDLKKIGNYCIDEVVIVKRSAEGEEIYNADSFVAPRQRILTDGTLHNFREWETNEETIINGGVACRISNYSKEGILNGNAFQQTGLKIFQFAKFNGYWKIISLTWEDD